MTIEIEKLLAGLDESQIRALTHALRAQSVDDENQRRILATAHAEARRIGVEIRDNRINVNELNAALRASGKSPEQRIAVKGIFAAAGLID